MAVQIAYAVLTPEPRDGDEWEIRVRLYDDGNLRLVEVSGQHVDDVTCDARALLAFLQEHLK